MLQPCGTLGSKCERRGGGGGWGVKIKALTMYITTLSVYGQLRTALYLFTQHYIPATLYILTLFIMSTLDRRCPQLINLYHIVDSDRDETYPPDTKG